MDQETCSQEGDVNLDAKTRGDLMAAFIRAGFGDADITFTKDRVYITQRDEKHDRPFTLAMSVDFEAVARWDWARRQMFVSDIVNLFLQEQKSFLAREADIVTQTSRVQGYNAETGGFSMRLKIEIDQETTERLIERAVLENRPIAWQAEVMLRQALGLPFPPEEISPSDGEWGRATAPGEVCHAGDAN